MHSQVIHEPRFWMSLLLGVIICKADDNDDYEKNMSNKDKVTQKLIAV